ALVVTEFARDRVDLRGQRPVNHHSRGVRHRKPPVRRGGRRKGVVAVQSRFLLLLLRTGWGIAHSLSVYVETPISDVVPNILARPLTLWKCQPTQYGLFSRVRLQRRSDAQEIAPSVGPLAAQIHVLFLVCAVHTA